MGQIVVDVGSFDLTSHNGNTAYSSIRYFDIPANAGITSCVATFATHVNTGNFQGKSFSLNGTQAHPNTPWPTSGIALNTALLSTGQNTFRAAVKSQAGLSARWSIGTIYLTIDYNDVSGGGGGSYTGGISVNKTYAEITGSDAITVSCQAQGGYWHYVTWEFGSLSGYWSHGWGAGGTGYLTPALNWAEQIPNAASGVLTIRVYIYNTPAPPHNLVSELVFTVTLGVPYWMAPSIAAFNAARIVNNTPASISDYVQNVSGVSLAVSGISGSYGSSIVSCVISGGGFSLNGTSGNIGQLPNAGNVDFTAEVTDSRGRKAYKSLNINVLAYTPITVSGVTAFRSNASKTPADEGLFASLKAKMVFSSLNGQNIGAVNGRVYEKGTSPPAWTVMANDTLVLFGGSLSIEKAYTAEIKVSDLISEQKYNIDIPTATVIMGIAPNGDGVSFGTYPEAGKVKSAWPLYAENKLVITESYKNEGTGYSVDSGLIINFKIPVSSAQNDWIFAEIVGGRDGDKPIFSQIQVNKYNTSWRNPIQKNYAYALPTAKFMELGGYIQLYIPSSPGILVVTVRSNNTGGRNPAPSVQGAASEPSGSNKVTCAIV